MALASGPGEGATAIVEIRVEYGPFENAIYVWQDELSFTGGASGNWGTPQAVTVTGENDDDEFDDLPELEHILIVGSKTALRPTVYVTVVDGNRAPYFVEGTDATRSVPETAGAGTNVGDPVEALDLNTSDTLTYTLEDTSGKFTIDSDGQIRVAADNSLDYETSTDHSLVVTVRDRATGGLTDNIQVKVLVTDVDEPLAVSGDASPTFAENASIATAVARYSASDPEGNAVSFTWSIEGANSGDFTIDTGGNLEFSSQPDHETQEEYSITIVGTDNADPFNVGNLPVTVLVVDVNEPPAITGDDSLTFLENIAATTVLHTYNTADPEGARSTFTWGLSGTDRGDFSIDGNGQLRFASSPDYERPGDSGGNNEYRFTVVATDDGTPAQVGRLDVTVNVTNQNEPPSVPTGSNAITVVENSTGNLGRYSSTDHPDKDDTVIWGVSGHDADDFRIDSSGNLAFDVTPDFEDPQDDDSNNVYKIKVDANDADYTSSNEVTVTVTPVDEPPVITGATNFGNWQENDESAIETYSAADPEGDTNIAWSLGGSDSGDFTIANGELKFAGTPDHESPADSGGNNHYVVIVEATESNNRKGTLHVDVIVQNVDEPPAITGPGTVDDFPENASTSREVGRYTVNDPERATVALSLTGLDSDKFSLASNGALTFNESPNYELQDGYTVTLQAEAGIHTGNTAVLKPVDVNVQNLEEQGTVTLSTVQPQEGTSLTAALKDDDVPSNISWQWYRTSSRGSTGAAIGGAISATYTPVEDDVGSYLRVAASYDDGHGTGKSAVVVSGNRVQEAPPVPEPPVFPAGGDYDRSINENQSAGRNVGAPVTATDGNSDRLTYSIGRSDYFQIIETTGQLRTTVKLDHEDRSQHFVTVTATDPGGLTDTVDVTVTVEDVDETPVVTGPTTLEFGEGTSTSTTLATFTSTDPDEEGVELVLAGTDSEDFDLSSRGELTFKEVPNYEDPADSGGNNGYRVTIEAREQGDGTSVARLNVVISVANVDEPGVVQTNAEETRVGQTVRLAVEDEDGGESVSEWKWERGEPNSPCIDVNGDSTVSNWETIPGANGGSYTPTAADQDKCLRATAFYSDRAGSGRTGQFMTTESVEFGPYFNQNPPTFSVSENAEEDINVGSRVIARHSNNGETLTYTLSGADAIYFSVDPATGQLKTSATALDYETQPDREAVVEITAEDNNAHTATITATISVTDECASAGELPCAPNRPAVRYDPSTDTNLLISWSAPGTPSGTTITGYGIQYRESESGGSWILQNVAGTDRSLTIENLTNGTTYEVQIRASNDSSGYGEWSQSGTGRHGVPPPPPPSPPPTPPTGGGNSGSSGGTVSSGGSGGGGGGGFSFGGRDASSGPPRPPALVGPQAVTRLFAPLLDNGTLERVWRFNNEDKSWAFYDPRPIFVQFNSLRLVRPPVILIVRVTRGQVFRGEQLSAGWNYINIR